MVADDTLMQQCHSSLYTQDGSMLTRETSELTGPDLCPPSRTRFQTSAITVLLCYFTYLFYLLMQ